MWKDRPGQAPHAAAGLRMEMATGRQDALPRHQYEIWQAASGGKAAICEPLKIAANLT